jgi:hypothetical protein
MVGQQLQEQYARLHARARFKAALDPTTDEVSAYRLGLGHVIVYVCFFPFSACVLLPARWISPGCED